ncbi:hypothetical protein TKK_0002031 [Trichogramma kaykai]|uniref:Spaetzle domain-containing protein n=1 Tax=Trichogramma kaykai TaxID=54128 RepID=A0ABD2X893_9HYME
MMGRVLAFLLLLAIDLGRPRLGEAVTNPYGYDGASACSSEKFSRAGRSRPLPCDLHTDSWCLDAGNEYPWHAVQRFVKENEGLMKRMYGNQRHLKVLKKELARQNIDVVIDHSGKKFYYPDDDDDDEDDYDASFRNKWRYDSRLDSSNHIRASRQLQDELVLPNEDGKDVKLNSSSVTTEAPSSPIPETSTSTTNGSTTSTTSTTISAKINLTVSSTNVQTSSTEKATTTTDSSLPAMVVSLSQIANIHNLNNNAIVEQQIDRSDVDVEELTEIPSTDAEVSEKQEFRPRPEYNKPTETTSSRPSPSETNSTVTEGQLFQDYTAKDKPEAPQPVLKVRGINACPVKEEVVAPFWANNTRGEVLALLNFYPFEQYVHWEKCTHEHKQMYCRDGCRCEQQYRLHRLLAYDPNNECRGIFSDWFKFPSCCVCRCYELPLEFRFTSRSPRQWGGVLKVRTPEPPPPVPRRRQAREYL